MQEHQLKINGMHCGGCKLAIENALKSSAGVKDATVNLSTAIARFSYDADIVSLDDITNVIEAQGYTVQENSSTLSNGIKTYLPVLGIIALGVMILLFSPLNIPSIASLPSGVSYFALLMIGLMTSVHCVGMCGGINLSVTLQESPNHKPWRASALYNSGRVVSYTLIGAALGATGAAFTLSIPLKAGITLFAGIFVALMGFKMLGIFQFLKIPKLMPAFITQPFLRVKAKQSGSFIIGLFNGFMPCGPLQAMQIYALSTGSWQVGALSMFFFSLGTTPLLFSFGLVASTLSKKFNRQLTRASGILLILLATIAISRGISLLPNESQLSNSSSQNQQQVIVGKKATLLDGYQEVIVDVSSRSYETIILQSNIPTRLIFRASATALNGCNDGIIIPSLDIQSPLGVGDTLVELDGLPIGSISYSCWMAMIKNRIYIVDSLSDLP